MADDREELLPLDGLPSDILLGSSTEADDMLASALAANDASLKATERSENRTKSEQDVDAKAPVGIVWFRRDLRIHDNLALHAALEHTKSGMSLLPIYIFKRPEIMLCGVNRFQFLIESVSGLATALSSRGSRLLVTRGEAETVLEQLFQAWNVTHLFFDEVSEPFGIERDARVRQMAERLGVQVETTKGCTLFDHDRVIQEHGGRAPKTYTSFLKTISTFPLPPLPLDPPSELPSLHMPLSSLYDQLVQFLSTVHSDGKEKALVLAGRNERFTVPNVTEFGFDPPTSHSFIYGGEAIALTILDEYTKNEGRVVRFEKPKTSPAETSPSSSTTSLSPYLFFGCMSPRKFYYRVRDIQERHKMASSAPPVSLDGQLLWREFFHCNGRNNPYFDKMEENPVCLQIDWRWHTIPDTEEEMTDEDRLSREHFEAWKEGRTGYPWIDAIMIQLKEEGWMHHLARHSAACFLTRGDLYISWVRGLEVFQERLIDHDWCINCGNWLWLSSSAYFSAYFRVYSPSTFGKKWDPDGKFIRKYIPALQKMPVKYIYEPWKSPMTVQRAAGCLIGKDYPFPIVDHKIALKKCMAGMKASYAKKEYGVPPTDINAHASVGKRTRAQSDASSEDSDGLY